MHPESATTFDRLVFSIFLVYAGIFLVLFPLNVWSEWRHFCQPKDKGSGARSSIFFFSVFLGVIGATIWPVVVFNHLRTYVQSRGTMGLKRTLLNAGAALIGR